MPPAIRLAKTTPSHILAATFMVVTGDPAKGWWWSGLLRFGAATALGLMLAPNPQPTWGSELVTAVGGYTIQNWQIEQGLPQISITSIAQTPDGYLWLGTFNGLVRFDGVSFTVFDEGNTPALGSSSISHLQVDEQGALWLVSLAGDLVRMAGGQFTRVLRQAKAPTLLGYGEFAPDAQRHLVVCDTNGWMRIEKGALLPLAGSSTNSSGAGPRLIFENSGGTWVVQQDKVTTMHDTPLHLTDGGSGSNTVSLATGSAAVSQFGGYWLSTDAGIYRLQGGKLSALVASPPPGVELPMSLKEDGQGNLWVSKWGWGLARLDANGTWEKFQVGEGLADNHVNCLFRDREGSIWAGTYQGGLHRFRPRVFQTYQTPGGARSSVVMSVTQDRQGRMWFAVNGGGLHTWSDGKLIPATEAAVFRSFPLAYSVLADRSDALWVGLYGVLALRWDSQGVLTNYLGSETGHAMTPQALLEDRNGTVWLGCTHGLASYGGGQLKMYGTADGLSSDTVIALAEDQHGTLYIGTDGGGLNCLRDGRFTAYTEKDGLADNHVCSLLVDQEGTLWIGTLNGGLNRFRSGQFVRFTVEDGLPSNLIGSLIEDNRGNLWIGSNRGILRVSRHQLNSRADGGREPLALQVFNLSDGLSTLGCTGGGQPRSWKDRDGKLWFATIKGAAVADPGRLPFNPLPPPVVIEQVVVGDRVQKLGNGVTVVKTPPRTHRLEFHFTGLSLLAPEEVRFRYKLEPYDENWIDAGTRRVAYYTGVRPDTYRFQVTACNNDSVWNESGATLSVVVPPPWWMSWWFRTLMTVSAVGCAFGWHEHRLRRVSRERQAQQEFSRRLITTQENERQRIAGELHDGMGQDLLVIKNRALLGLKRDLPPAQLLEHLSEISQMASRTLEEVRAISRNLRPYQIDRLGLTTAMRSMVTSVSSASGLRCAGEFDALDGLLPSALEIHVYRIVQELLNNVIKHSNASACSVRARREGDRLVITVEDDGRGFDRALVAAPSQDARGIGLATIVERVSILNGSWRCDSQPGQGTVWQIHIPIHHEN